MSINSSTSDTSIDLTHSFCSNITESHSIGYALIGTRLLLLLPTSIYILNLAFQHWQKQRSFKAASHSDIFTHHLVILELTWSLGSISFIAGSFLDLSHLTMVGFTLMHTIDLGETLFHVLTCVDRHLAVVHPVTYRRLRNTSGVTVRNISILCAWLLSFLWSYTTMIYYPALPIVPFFCFLLSSFVIVSFCSISVLRVLLHPEPGQLSKNKRQVDQTKQRAFFTITMILGMLCLWFVGFLIAMSLRQFSVLSNRTSCLVYRSMMWFNLPSSLVLQLLYLHKNQ